MGHDSSNATSIFFFFFSFICSSQFFSLDRFLLIGEGNRLQLFSYTRPSALGKDTLRRRVSPGKMKLLSSYPTANPSCLYVTAFGGINSILSSSLLVCGSDKSLSFLDLHTGTHLQTTRT